MKLNSASFYLSLSLLPINDMTSFLLKGKKNEYQVNIDGTTTPASLMQQVEQLTGVPVANQKIMAKKGWKGVLSSSTKLKVKPGKTTLSLMGSAAATINATTAASGTTVSFVEDMSKNDALKAINATPPGLANLGNTCYMNSTLQCLRYIPELRAALAASMSISGGAPEVKFTQDLNRLYQQMDSVFAPDAVTPQEFVFTLRHQFSMFADRAPNGAYVQQDADEFYSTVMRCLGGSLTRSQLPMNLSVLKDVFGDREGLPPTDSVVDALFSIGFETKETCAETDDEDVVTRTSKDVKLRCNIVGGAGSDTKVDHLYQGLELGLSGEIEKRSEKLGRNAVWKKETKIKRLPRYLCLQYMRFYWKSREATTHDTSTGTACKMKRRVQFADTMDMFKFCSDDLQKSLRVAREASINLKEHEAAEKASASASKSEKEGETKDDKETTAKTDGSEDKPTPMEIDNDDDDAEALAAALAMSTGNATPSFAGYGLPSDFQGQYELFAIVTHIGRSVNSGHYMGWVKSEQKGSDDWLRFNDSEVDPCKFVDIKDLDGGTGDNDMVYLALYRPLK